MRRALQLALEIYAKIPLIPRSLFLNGVNIEVKKRTGTLVNGRHKTKVAVQDLAYGISVRYQLSTASLEYQ